MLYVADSGNNRVQVVDSEGNFISEYGVRGWRTGEFDNPTDVAINFQRTELLYVADTDNNRIQYCNLIDRIFYIMAGSRLVGVNEEDDIDAEIEFDLPGGVSVGRNGEVCVVDTGNHRFILFNPDGIRMLMRGGFGGARQQFRDPTDLVADAHGNIYIVDSGNHRIKKYDFSGNLVQIWGTEGEVPGQFREPRHIDIDRWGYLYVTDRANQRVQVFTTDGEAVMTFGAEALVEPGGIAIFKNDLVFVSDVAANDVKVFQIVYRP
jgi:DNA-binding beta-propeller fold protein YncE